MKKQNNEKETGKRFKLGSILSTKEENKEMTLPQKVEAISCYVLESKGCFDSAHSMTATDIYKEYKNIKSNRNHKNIFDVELPTFRQYLSGKARDNDSPITKKDGQNGYFLNLSEPLYDIDEDNSIKSVKECPDEEGSFHESEMYPVLAEWLKVKGGYVKNIGAQHCGPKWTNPDVMGIKFTRFFESIHIEVTTIEAKLSSQQWRTDLFQAVAHTMFANKVYYAYMRNKSDKPINEMILYAQKFGIGIIAVGVPDVKGITKGQKIEQDDIVEILPAPYHEVEIQLQKEFLDNFDIHNVDDIITKSDQ